MPFKSTEHFPGPDDDGQDIWRYLEFPQFLSMLERGSLWFNQAIRFDDPLEGGWTTPDLQKVVEATRELDGDVDAEKVKQEVVSSREMYGANVYVNCWHMNEVESSAMWDRYSLRGGGVAVKTTIGGLKDAFAVEEEYDIHLAPVQYVNYRSENVLEGYLPKRFIYKHLSHEADNELRALVNLNEVIEVATEEAREKELHLRYPEQPYQHYPRMEPYSSLLNEPLPPGLQVNVDVNLLEEVVVAPNTATWKIQLLEDVSETYGYDSLSISPSSLNDDILD